MLTSPEGLVEVALSPQIRSQWRYAVTPSTVTALLMSQAVLNMSAGSGPELGLKQRQAAGATQRWQTRRVADSGSRR